MSISDEDADNPLLERKYSITREIYTMDKFLQHYPKSPEVQKSFSPYKILKKCTCSKFASLLSFVFPFYSVLAPFYNLQSFLSDLVAGLTLSIVHIPQGLVFWFESNFLNHRNGIWCFGRSKTNQWIVHLIFSCSDLLLFWYFTPCLYR